MILNCNSCGKKFVVPDKAITASGRLVQCGSCGNKWKQFPINENQRTGLSNKVEEKSSNKQKTPQKTQKPKKAKKAQKVQKNPKKTKENNRFSLFFKF